MSKVKDNIDRDAEREGKALRKQGFSSRKPILRLQSEYRAGIERKLFKSDNEVIGSNDR